MATALILPHTFIAAQHDHGAPKPTTEAPADEALIQAVRDETNHLSPISEGVSISPSIEDFQEPISSEIGAAAVCDNNSNFVESPINRHPSICRLYLKQVSATGEELISRCSGSFISEDHILTAGHCLVNNTDNPKFGYNMQKRDDNYGTVCCSPTRQDTRQSCPVDAQFDIVDFTTTIGYLARPSIFSDNDGAVLKVRRRDNTNDIYGVPLRYGSIVNEENVERFFRYSGFPANSPRAGCDRDWFGRRYLSESTQTPASSSTPGGRLTLRSSSGCGAMSGGPLMTSIGGSMVIVGVIKGGSIRCTEAGTGGTSSYLFSLNVPRDHPTPAGFNIESLMKSLP
ncbi:hypothetical protein Ndes2526B_g01613 [Nannochloris sp. 'desiccata']|nr:hypothetical protein KSW81_005888 [Chlorella desiccata (nom. nud.)]KAH7623192.1 hypothetical protein NADE_002386 [Chlorella desiccata (nom. nud.)]